VPGIPGVSSLCLISSKREKTQFYSNHRDLSRRERETRDTFTEGGGGGSGGTAEEGRQAGRKGCREGYTI
jgi:hypothetical protein